MPALSFEVGAIFAIDAQPAISSLEAIGQAFASLETMLRDTVAATQTAVQEMVGEVGRLAEAWRAVGAEARAGAGAGAGAMGGGGGGGRGGGRGRLTDEERAEREAERQLREDRMNADAINRNEDQIYRRQYAAAIRDNDAYNRAAKAAEKIDDGMIGPPPRPYWGQDDDWANARAEDQNYNAVRANERRIEAERRAGWKTAWGHVGGVFRGMGPLMTGLGVFEAEKGAMTEERSLTQALQEMGLHPGDPGYGAALEQLRGAVRTGTDRTIYSESQGANVLPGTAGQFGAVFATPEERLKNYTEILPTAMKFAEVAEQYHRGTMQESMKAAISYSHMTHRYTSGELGGGLDHLLALSLATGETVAGEQSILKYGVPLGMAAGVNPDDAAAMVGFFQMMGFSGTTAATGYGQMLMGLTGTGGPLAAQQQQRQRTHDVARFFEKTLHMEPSEIHARVQHATRDTRHERAMQALGLFDAQGHVRQDVAPGGKLNQQVFMQRIEEYLKSHDPMTDLSTLRDAFTVRGAREGAILQDPSVIEKLNTFIENMKNVQSAEQLQKELQEQTLPRFERMLASINNIGITLATQTLPGLNSAFGTMNEYLLWFNTKLRENPLVAEVGGYGLLFGGVATALGLFRLALLPATSTISLLVRGLTGFSTAATAAGAAATEVGTGLTSMIMPITGLLAALSAGGYYGGKWLKDHLPESITGSGAAREDILYRMTHGGKPHWMEPHWNYANDVLGVPRGPGATPGYGGLRRDPERNVGMPTPPAPTLTMEIRNVFNGVFNDAMMREIIDKVEGGLKGFLERAGELVHGTLTSPFTGSYGSP